MRPRAIMVIEEKRMAPWTVRHWAGMRLRHRRVREEKFE
jgi:hypothetical protein